MSLPNPGMVFTPFDPLPASDLNDIVENVEALADGSGLNDLAVTTAKIDDGAITSEKLSSTVSFKAYHTGSQSLTAGSYGVIQFNTEVYDTGSDFNTTTYKFVAPVAGIYHFDGRLNWTAMGAQDWASALYKNGSVIAYGDYMSGAADEGGNSSTGVSTDLKLAANDEVQLFGYVQTSARTVKADVTLCYFSGHLVGAV